MQKISTLLFIASILLCLVLGCTSPFKRYKCTSTAVVSPKNADDYIKIADDHGHRRENDCAYAACNEAVRLEPKNANAYACRGRYTFGNREKERQDYARAIELDSKTIDAYVFRGLSYESNGETDAAVKDLEIVVRLCPGQCNPSYVAYVHRRLGDLYMKRKDYESAVLDYTESVRLAPEVPDAYSGRAKANRQLERYEAADADAVKVVELQGAQFGAKPPERIELGILNYRAMSLPQPPNLDVFGKRVYGDVEIAVEVNEAGQVTKAWGQNGNPFLFDAVVPAAERVHFKPVLLNGKPAKFTGLVRYTFTAPK